MIKIEYLGQRIDMTKATELVALAWGRAKPVSRSTIYRLMRNKKFPQKIHIDGKGAVWDTQECLNHLGLNQ